MRPYRPSRQAGRFGSAGLTPCIDGVQSSCSTRPLRPAATGAGAVNRRTAAPPRQQRVGRSRLTSQQAETMRWVGGPLVGASGLAPPQLGCSPLHGAPSTIAAQDRALVGSIVRPCRVNGPSLDFERPFANEPGLVLSIPRFDDNGFRRRMRETIRQFGPVSDFRCRWEFVLLDAPLEKALRVGRLDHRGQVGCITRWAAPWIDSHLEAIPVVSPRVVVDVAVGSAAVRAAESGRPAAQCAVIHASPSESRRSTRWRRPDGTPTVCSVHASASASRCGGTPQRACWNSLGTLHALRPSLKDSERGPSCV